jgi:hypothetical protein
MGKLILGIIAVVCLEIAFVAHVTVNSEFEVPAVALNTGARDSLVDLNSLDELDSYGLTDPVADAGPDSLAETRKISAEPAPVVDRRQQYSARLSDKRIQKQRVDLLARRTDSRSASRTRSERAALGQSIVIFYDRGPEISYDKTKTSNKTIILPAAEKNSFFAKALNVIKKPWDWTKFAASKLR